MIPFSVSSLRLGTGVIVDAAGYSALSGRSVTNQNLLTGVTGVLSNATGTIAAHSASIASIQGNATNLGNAVASQGNRIGVLESHIVVPQFQNEGDVLAIQNGVLAWVSGVGTQVNVSEPYADKAAIYADGKWANAALFPLGSLAPEFNTFRVLELFSRGVSSDARGWLDVGEWFSAPFWLD